MTIIGQILEERRNKIDKPQRPQAWRWDGHAVNLHDERCMCHDLVIVKARRKWHVPFLIFWESIRRPRRRSVIVTPE